MKTTNIALLGFNKLSEKYARSLLAHKQFQIVGIMGDYYPSDLAFRDVSRVEDFETLVSAQNVDIVVDTCDDVKLAYAGVRAALEEGKHVVTSNAGMMAIHGQKLMRLAADKNVALQCNATVMGGVPVLSNLSTHMKGAHFNRVYGVVSHVCQYALMRMQQRDETLEDAVQAAVEFHYAHPNPSTELSGKDTLYKAALLRAAAFNEWTDLKNIYYTGLTGLLNEDIQMAADLGYQIKHMAVATADTLDVRPYLLEEGVLFTSLSGNLTAVVAESDNAGPVFFSSFGADVDALAATLLNDTFSISAKQWNKHWLGGQEQKSHWLKGRTSRYYVRVLESERDVLSSMTAIEILAETQCAERVLATKKERDEVAQLNNRSVLTTDMLAQLQQQAEIQQKASNVVSLHGGLSGLGRTNLAVASRAQQQAPMAVNASDISTSRSAYVPEDAKIYTGLVIETGLNPQEIMSQFDTETATIIEIFSA